MTTIQFFNESFLHDECKTLCIIMAYFFHLTGYKMVAQRGLANFINNACSMKLTCLVLVSC